MATSLVYLLVAAAGGDLHADGLQLRLGQLHGAVCEPHLSGGRHTPQ